jgi:hypothetical protein
MRLAGRPALVTHSYPHPVVTVVELAHYAAARGVDDRVRDQFGDDQGGRVAGVVAHCPAAEVGARQLPGLSGRARVGSQFEAAAAAYGRGAGARTGFVTERSFADFCS